MTIICWALVWCRPWVWLCSWWAPELVNWMEWFLSLPLVAFTARESLLFFSIPVVLCGLVCPLVLLYGFLSLVESPYDKWRGGIVMKKPYRAGIWLNQWCSWFSLNHTWTGSAYPPHIPYITEGPFVVDLVDWTVGTVVTKQSEYTPGIPAGFFRVSSRVWLGSISTYHRRRLVRSCQNWPI